MEVLKKVRKEFMATGNEYFMDEAWNFKVKPEKV
jgi:hypothetical protein